MTVLQYQLLRHIKRRGGKAVPPLLTRSATVLSCSDKKWLSMRSPPRGFAMRYTEMECVMTEEGRVAFAAHVLAPGTFPRVVKRVRTALRHAERASDNNG